MSGKVVDSFGQEESSSIAVNNQLIDILMLKREFLLFLNLLHKDLSIFCGVTEYNNHIFYSKVLSLPDIPDSFFKLLSILLSLPIGKLHS